MHGLDRGAIEQPGKFIHRIALERIGRAGADEAGYLGQDRVIAHAGDILAEFRFCLAGQINEGGAALRRRIERADGSLQAQRPGGAADLLGLAVLQITLAGDDGIVEWRADLRRKERDQNRCGAIGRAGELEWNHQQQRF